MVVVVVVDWRGGMGWGGVEAGAKSVRVMP